MASDPRPEFGVAQVTFEVAIRADQRRVWRALTEETERWWDRSFFVNPAARALVVEPRLGGRVYEDWGEGAGVCWYLVIGVEPPNLLMLQGQLNPTYGGPAVTTVQLVLEPAEGVTVLRLSETAFGRIDAKLEAFIRQAWQALFEQGLKPYAESSAGKE